MFKIQSILRFCLLLILINLIQFVSGSITNLDNIFYVDDDGGADFLSIQDAINNANFGDTIFVYNGTYYENIFINTTINLIGENKNSTIIDGDKQKDVIYIGFSANNVNITGFTIQNSGNSSSGGAIFDAGIEIHSDYNNIINTANDPDGSYGWKFPHKGEGKIIPTDPLEWKLYISTDLAKTIMERFQFYNNYFGYC